MYNFVVVSGHNLIILRVLTYTMFIYEPVSNHFCSIGGGGGGGGKKNSVAVMLIAIRKKN